MAGNFRIFLSSTMDDLANERALIEQRIRSYNFECVRAETMEPNGAGSWQRIQDAIDSCHLFVLLSGERYGWVPKKGPLAGEKLAVTHGEFRYAKERGLPILAFFKRLTAKAPQRTKDAIARNQFRAEVEGWLDGVFRTEFDLANDLADKVGNSITSFLSNQFLRQQAVDRPVRLAPPRPPAAANVALPRELVEAVRHQQAVLFAGAGISFAAGLPSAAFFAETLVNGSREYDQEYGPSATGMGIASIAADYERFAGREALGDKIRLLLQASGTPVPTAAHIAAVKIFSRIITTNYDNLFDDASASQGTGHAGVVDPATIGPLPEPFLLKLHGTLRHPETIVITEDDVDRFEFTHARLLPEVARLLDEYMPVVVGSSLRDPTIYRLFRNRRWAGGNQTYGYVVVPVSNPCIEGRHKLLGLQTLEAPLESFFPSLLATVPAVSTHTAPLP
ncbi:MAG: SIR2 family protein [Acidobacteriota bacterium]